jgi:sugar/nucleoside kinase (ribokinase family)
MKEFDFVAIGDITTDAFIRLSEKHARIINNLETGRSQIAMNFGDKLPYEKVDVVRSVGNSPNAAVSAHRLGLNSALMTNLGDDDNGKKCLKALGEEGIPTDLVTVQKGIKTNYHYVLQYQAERTILIKHEEYEYRIPEKTGKPTWFYLSSIGHNSLPFHETIADYLEKNSEIHLAFQPGTFQMELGIEKLERIYKRTNIFFCNVQEAQRILKTKESDVKKLLQMFHEIGPKIVLITDGPNGAYAYDGNEGYFMPMYPDLKEPIDRTGAGDSFSSTFTSAIALGKDISEAIMWGPINSMSVVQYVGAQKGLLSRKKLEEYLNNAPANYKPEKIL